MEIKRLTEATEQAAQDLSKLASALHNEERHMAFQELEALVNDKNITLMVAIDEGHIVGMGTNYLVSKIASSKCYLEDLVVDESCRGKGVGTLLINALIEAARIEGVRSLEFMTATHRKDAHRFYEKLGFAQKDQLVYKMKF
jgi:GNAT superfamily N-acetyltransferase